MLATCLSLPLLTLKSLKYFETPNRNLCVSLQVKDYFKDWEPWKNPSHGVTTVKEWQYILEDYNNKYNTSLHNMNVFQRLLWDIWLPFVRTAIL